MIQAILNLGFISTSNEVVDMLLSFIFKVKNVVNETMKTITSGCMSEHEGDSQAKTGH